MHAGTFSPETLAAIPESYMVGPRWEALIAASAEKHGMTHLHAYHLGVIAAERLDFDRARDLFALSISKQPTVLAHRNLAAIFSEADEQVKRWENYKSAWDLLTSPNAPSDELSDKVRYSLGGEIAMFLVTTSYLHGFGVNGSLVLWSELNEFLESIQVSSFFCFYCFVFLVLNFRFHHCAAASSVIRRCLFMSSSKNGDPTTPQPMLPVGMVVHRHHPAGAQLLRIGTLNFRCFLSGLLLRHTPPLPPRCGLQAILWVCAYDPLLVSVS